MERAKKTLAGIGLLYIFFAVALAIGIPFSSDTNDLEVAERHGTAAGSALRGCIYSQRDDLESVVHENVFPAEMITVRSTDTDVVPYLDCDGNVVAFNLYGVVYELNTIQIKDLYQRILSGRADATDLSDRDVDALRLTKLENGFYKSCPSGVIAACVAAK